MSEQSEDSKWVKVKDRLPDLERDVFGSDGSNVYAMHFGTAKGRYPLGKFLPTWFKPNEWMYMGEEKR